MDCRIPLCSQTYYNGGICAAPNTCACPADWSGFDCLKPVCHQGFFKADDVVDLDKTSFWLEYRPCNISAWCDVTHSFECEQNIHMIPVLPLYGPQWR